MSAPTLFLPSSDPSTLPLPELPISLILQSNSLPDRDALDTFIFGGENVDVEDVLNGILGEESSGPQTALIGHLLRQKIQLIRQEIDELKLILEQDQQEENMEVLSGYVGDLLTQVTLIRDAATESEMVVREITRDIQSLDLAKKNLIASMNALKRFQMLVIAFDQLTALASSRKYRETAQALSAVQQLSQFFGNFSSVERVAVVRNGVMEVMNVLRGQVLKEFTDAFENDSSRTGKNTVLTDAALVIDILGAEAKHSLLTFYSAHLLRDYRKVFLPSSEAGQLDNIARRYAWFRRVLQAHEMENASLFPSSWNVAACLAGGFAEITREDLKSVLLKTGSTLQVTLLLESLQETTEFEQQMIKKFSMPFESIVTLSAVNTFMTGPPENVSSVFEPYLGVVVDAQERILSEMMASFTSSRISISPLDNPSSVLPSSTELFYFYREALERVANLSNGKPLLALCNVYKKWLKVYAEEVLIGSLVKFERRSGESRPYLPDIQTACLVLNTAEYCLVTAAQLEEKLLYKIIPTLQSSISFTLEKDQFLSTISTCMTSILRELELTIELPFAQMLKSPWREVEFVSSESQFIPELLRGILSVVEAVREGLELKKYARSLCDKVVGLVLAKFTQTLVRCRPISQTGAEQILLDLSFVKSTLLRLPLAPGDATPIPVSYSRYVSKSILKIDTLLKVIMAPTEPAEDFIKHYILLIPSQSFSDFQKIIDLKGIKKSEQTSLIDLFLSKISLIPSLSDMSFLTSIDLDPNPSISLTLPPPPASANSNGINSSNSNSNLNFLSNFGGNPGNNGIGSSSLSNSSNNSRVATPVGERDRIFELRKLGARFGLGGRN